jgi:signal transduction histidine kinase
MRDNFRKTLLGFGAATAFLLLCALVLLLVSVYRNAARFAPVEHHLEYIAALRTLERDIELEIDQSMPTGAMVSEDAVTRLLQQITALNTAGVHLSDATPEKLQELYRQIDRLGSSEGIPATKLLDLLADLIDSELESRRLLLATISDDLRQEKRVMTLTAAIIPLLAAGLFLLFRQNVVLPARKIADLLGELGERKFRIVDARETSPTLRPVIENYNSLVGRLTELEAVSRDRQTTLERQVQLTTGSLMRLQGVLANAEKLAVVGEFAATLAHELRNPLAGIRAALDNLRSEIDTPDQKERLDLVIGELKRMTSLLNNLLEQTSVTPETPVYVNIASAVGEVVQLARLQLPETVRIEHQIDPQLNCRLPEDRFRQAILNLLLNSGQVAGQQDCKIVIAATRAGNSTKIVVSDDGPGFPTSVIEAGPQSFVTRRDHGTGLGLAIVRRFCRDLDGRLSIANIEPHGARVELELQCGENHGK